MFEVKNLCKNYGKFRALNHLDMIVEEGELFGFVGPNGAGKTTTLKILAGLLKADEGQVVLDGVNALKQPNRLKEAIGYMPDFFGVYDNLRVSEYMEFYAAAYGIYGLQARTQYRELLDMVDLADKEDFYVDGLSRGMKQRLCLARALIHNPKILILDEPASGLDPRTRYQFREILKDLNTMGKTILISSHILSELSEMCTDIGIIDGGRMVLRGSMVEILTMVNSANPLEIVVCDKLDEALKLLRRHKLVRTISVDSPKIVVTFGGNQKDEAFLLKMLVEAGVMVNSFVRKQGSLETLFMQITENKDERLVSSNEA